MTVKAKDVLFAGDDINEFGYFPENISTTFVTFVSFGTFVLAIVVPF